MRSGDGRAEPASSADRGGPRRAWLVALALLGCVTALVVTVGFPLQRWNLAAGLGLTELGLILLPVLIVTGVRGETKTLLARGGLRLRDVPPVILIGVAAFTGSLVAGGVAYGMMRLAGFAPPAPRLLSLLLQQGDLVSLGAVLLGGAVLAPVCEEALFRGVVQGALRRVLPVPVAVVVTAVLFALFHLHPVRFAPTLVLGLVAGWLAERHRSLWAAVLVHAVVNGLGLAVGLLRLAAGAAN